MVEARNGPVPAKARVILLGKFLALGSHSDQLVHRFSSNGLLSSMKCDACDKNDVEAARQCGACGRTFCEHCVKRANQHKGRYGIPTCPRCEGHLTKPSSTQN